MDDMQHRVFDARKVFEEVEAGRTQLGVSQAKLCRVADLDTTTYAKLIMDPDRVPHRRTVRKLQRALATFQQEAAE